MLRKLPSAVIAVALLLSAAASLPSFGQTLRITMTASDIRPTTGIQTMAAKVFAFSAFRHSTG